MMKLRLFLLVVILDVMVPLLDDMAVAFFG